MRQYLIVGSLLLSGCVGLPSSTSQQTLPEQEQGRVPAKTALPIVQAPKQVPGDSPVAKVAVVSQPQRQFAEQPKDTKVLPTPKRNQPPTDAVAHWLSLAAQAMAKDHLTTPAGDNAYAYYGRVLLLEPQNPKALAGLQQIVQRYHHLALASQRKGKSKQVRLFMQRANKVVPNHPDKPAVEAQLASIAAAKKSPSAATKLAKSRQAPMKFSALQTQQQSVLEAPAGMQRQRILLPPSALQLEAPALAIYLRQLARQIEQVDGRLYIIAPRDKQVRWVYSLLNGTNPDYRIRANMKHKKPAAIEVMYSGDQPVLDVFE